MILRIGLYENSIFLKLDEGQRKENGQRGKHVDQLRIERFMSLQDHCPCLKQLSSKLSVKVVGDPASSALP